MIAHKTTLEPKQAVLSEQAESRLKNSIWKPGQSGNRFGRPKTKDFNRCLHAWLKIPALVGKGKTAIKATNLERVLESCLRNRPEVLLHYAFGKPTETIEISDPDGLMMRNQMVIELARAIVQQSQNPQSAIEVNSPIQSIQTVEQDASYPIVDPNLKDENDEYPIL